MPQPYLLAAYLLLQTIYICLCLTLSICQPFTLSLPPSRSALSSSTVVLTVSR